MRQQFRSVPDLSRVTLCYDRYPPKEAITCLTRLVTLGATTLSTRALIFQYCLVSFHLVLHNVATPSSRHPPREPSSNYATGLLMSPGTASFVIDFKHFAFDTAQWCHITEYLLSIACIISLPKAAVGISIVSAADSRKGGFCGGCPRSEDNGPK
jgi:hypothetical protein